MTENTHDSAAAEPYEITKRADETDGDFARVETTVHPLPGESNTDHNLSHHRFLIDNPDDHIHPNHEELIKVLSGEYGVALAGTEHRLNEGEEITVPTNTPHRHWNPTEQPIRVDHDWHPSLQFEELTETLYMLAQAGKTNEKGIPNLLQFAVINNAYPGHAYTTDLPISVQKALFRLLAPIGRLAGHEATYSREDIDDLR